MPHGHQRRLALVCVLTLLPAMLGAQTGRLSGTVRTTDGGALSGITLIITSPALVAPKTVVTDANGRFEVAGLPPGRVSVTCQAPGFAQWRRDAVEITPNGSTTLNVTMKLDAHQLLGEIDKYLGQLDTGNIAFNAPERMLVGESLEVRLLLSPLLSADALRDKLAGMPGMIQGAAVKIAPRMEAVLTGPNFEVLAITPALQAVARDEPTEWRWQVTPRSTGNQRLFLALNVSIEGTSRTLRTFDRTIEVRVTLSQQVSGFVSRNWQWLWATAIVPLAGWLWRRRQSSSRAVPRATRARR